ncbi:uncharacterized protein MELLADRAFT_109217 [Melampsora larici-populina 98AG31]|uniref:Uncharacterized protein n=1 Tax=Melampsora larici-populina (strain 98AG31 / pathotype 3-4-7) TaxID=747676 RepID=F4RVR8_MELLP|nr:uncharacterized protein MELLADRAFT_109217 [Melampsora larici-populina 98AG31]EGG03409.1 hypothetical protein MELLADRAFT_109217 [Melampsora larici-populina 98AG31]
MQELSRLATNSRNNLGQSGLRSQENNFQHSPPEFKGISLTYYAPCKIGDEEWITDPQLAVPDAWLGEVRLFQKENDAREWVTAQIKASNSVPVQTSLRKETSLNSEGPRYPQDDNIDRFSDAVHSQAAGHRPGRTSSYTSYSDPHMIETGSKLNLEAKSYVPSLAKANTWPEQNTFLVKEKEFPKNWEMNERRDEKIERGKARLIDETKRRIETSKPTHYLQKSGSSRILSEEKPNAQPDNLRFDKPEFSELETESVQTWSHDERDKKSGRDLERTKGFHKAPMRGQLRTSKAINRETEKGRGHSSEEKLHRPKIVTWSKKKTSSMTPKVDQKGIAATQEDTKGKERLNPTLMKEACHEEYHNVNPFAVIRGSHLGQEPGQKDTGASSDILDTTNTVANNADNVSVNIKEVDEASSQGTTDSKKHKKKTRKIKASSYNKKNKMPLNDEWDDIPIAPYNQDEVNLNKRLCMAKILHHVLKSQNKQEFMTINLSDEAFKSVAAIQPSDDIGSILEDLDSYQAEFNVLIGKPESYRRFKALRSQLTQRIITKNWKALKDKCDSSVKDIVRLLGGHLQWPIFYDTRNGESELIVEKISQLNPQQIIMLQSIIDVDEQENRVATMYAMERINKEYVPKVFTEKKLQYFQKQGVCIPSILKMEHLLHLTSPLENECIETKTSAEKILEIIDLMDGEIDTVHGQTFISDDIEWINSPVRKCFVEENEGLKKVFEECLWRLVSHGRILGIPYEALDEVGAIGKVDLKSHVISLDRALIATHFSISIQELAKTQFLHPEEIAAVFEALKVSSEALRDRWVQLNLFVKRLKYKVMLAIMV